MFFQFSRFWQNYGFTSQLDTLLEKPDCTVEQILEEENILVELKNSGATKFAKFITKDPRLYEKLIDYITSYSEERTDTRTQVKYPFLISEVFASENQGLIDFLFDKPAPEEPKEEDEKRIATDGEEETPQVEPQIEAVVVDPNESARQALLPHLLNFLNQDCICVTSAGYFNKMFVPIIKRRGHDLWAYLNKNPQVVTDLIKHIDVTHIADIVQKLIILDTQTDSDVADTHIAERKNLLQRLLNVIQMKSYNPLVVENIAYIFCEIIQQGLNPNVFHGKDLHSLIEVIDRPLRIFEFGVQTQSPTVLQVLVYLLEWHKSRASLKSNKEDDDMTNYQDMEEESMFYGYFEIPSRIPNALKSQVSGNQFRSTFGQDTIPMTQAKMTILQILHQMLQTGDAQFFELIAESHVFLVIQTLVLQHQFNNQVQILFEKMVTLTFENAKAAVLQERLIADGLLNFLQENNDNKTFSAGTMKNQVKKGYQGVLTKLSNYLNKLQKTNKFIGAAGESWTNYVKGTLATINAVENSFLCGVNPKNKGRDDDDSEPNKEVQDILNRFEQHRQVYTTSNTAPESPEEDMNDDKGDQDEFQDVQDHDNPNEHKERRDSSSSDEEMIQEKINEAIASPRSAPQEISDLIQMQEKMELNDNMQPEEIEKKSDSEVIQYWKHHQDSPEHHVEAKVEVEQQAPALEEDIKPDQESPVSEEPAIN